MSHSWTTGGVRAHVVRTAAALAMLALVIPNRPASAQATEIRIKEPVTVPLPSGARVEVYGGSGYILLKKATGADVVVSVVKSKLAETAPVLMLKTTEGITICAVYPTTDPKKPHECLPGGKGRIYSGNPEKLPDIGIIVEMPDGMAATASMGAGEVRSTSVTGDVKLYSDRGKVSVTDGGAGSIRADVGLLGNIQVILARGQRAREVRLNSPGMGMVRVIMPKELTVKYRVSTQRPPRIDPAMGITAKKGLLLAGSIGGLATEVDLIVDTGITGEFVFQYAVR